MSSPYKRLKKDKMKVGVLISGSGTNLQALIDHCKKKKSSAEIVVVISNVENVYGLQRATSAHIPVKVRQDVTYLRCTLKAFTKPFEAPQRSVKIKI